MRTRLRMVGNARTQRKGGITNCGSNGWRFRTRNCRGENENESLWSLGGYGVHHMHVFAFCYQRVIGNSDFFFLLGYAEDVFAQHNALNRIIFFLLFFANKLKFLPPELI